MSTGTSENNSRLCGICEENVSKYCCPRCDVFYCSLDCYKSEKHLQCSEGFYRDCVNEELSSLNVDDDSKKKMIDILKRMNNESAQELDDIQEADELDSDDDDGIDLEDRIKDLNLDDADAVWNALTEDEKNEFQALIEQGDVGSIVPQWEPWWTYRKEKKVVEEITDGTEENEEDEALKKCPQVKTIPELSSLTKTQPSATVKSNIVNVLAAYAFVARYFNGEVEEVAAESAACLLDVCAGLGDASFQDPATAVEAVAQKCLQSDKLETDEASLGVMRYDVYLILRGPSEWNETVYCLAALSHLIDIFTAAKSLFKAQNKDNGKFKTTGTFSKKFPDHDKSDWCKIDAGRIKKVIKKIEYYLSYVQSYGMDFT